MKHFLTACALFSATPALAHHTNGAEPASWTSAALLATIVLVTFAARMMVPALRKATAK